MSTKTFQYSRERALQDRKWFLVDAEGAVLGRLATRVARLLRGKGKAGFTPSVDCGDFVIVVNADKVRLTGDKESQKRYYHHTGYAGGIYSHTAEQARQRNPERMVESAVRGMLPRNRLGRSLAGKLKVYRGPEHPHQAQQPERVSIGD